MKKTFEQILDEQGKLVYTFKGVSMMPLLKSGRDLVVIEKMRTNEYDPMDVVLFKRKNKNGDIQYVLHRILKKNDKGMYWIVGDNCFTGDYVKEEQILGKMTSIIRNKREVQLMNSNYVRYVAMWCKPYRIRMLLLKVENKSKFYLRQIWKRKEEPG